MASAVATSSSLYVCVYFKIYIAPFRSVSKILFASLTVVSLYQEQEDQLYILVILVHTNI